MLSLKTEEKFRKCKKKKNLSVSKLRLQYCLRNLRIACKAVHVVIPLGYLNLKLIIGGNIKKSFYHLRNLYSPRLVQSYHYEPNLIWCEGTFKHLRQLSTAKITKSEEWIQLKLLSVIITE
jgi:hypothetical protein